MNRPTESWSEGGALDVRLRAHFADRTAREPLPGPADDRALAEVVAAPHADRLLGNHDEPEALQASDAPDADASDTSHGVIRLIRRRPLLLAAAAAAVILLVVVGVVAIGDDEPAPIVTEPSPPTSDTADDPSEPDETPTTGPETTSSPDTTASPDPTTTTSDPEPAATGSEPTGPIVAVEGILGTWSGSEWVPWQRGDTPPYGDEYTIVGLDGQPRTAVGTAAPDCMPDAAPSIDVGLRFGDDPLAPLPVAVTGVADPRPRPVEVLDPSAEAYRAAAVDVVTTELGITDPSPQVRQVVRSDLDGDGTSEVVVVADSIGDPQGSYATKGDFAVVFVRRVVGGAVRTTVVSRYIADVTVQGQGEGELRRTFAEVFRLGAVADLNGDGQMELVINTDYYEGSWTFVHELRPDGTAPEVLNTSCGA